MKRSTALVAVALLGSAISADAGFATAASVPTPQTVEAWVRAWVAAWTAHDAAELLRLDPPAPGFGYRDLQPRSGDRPLGDALRTFFAGMDYYRIDLNEIHTAVDGETGLAGGFLTEDFKEKGRAPEKLRVRFTQTLKYKPNGWRTLLFHRDVQPFDQQGKYLRQ